MGFMNEMSGNVDYAQSKHSLSSDTVVDSGIPSARHVPRVSLQSLLYTRALSVRCVAGLCIDCTRGWLEFSMRLRSVCHRTCKIVIGML